MLVAPVRWRRRGTSYVGKMLHRHPPLLLQPKRRGENASSRAGERAETPFLPPLVGRQPGLFGGCWWWWPLHPWLEGGRSPGKRSWSNVVEGGKQARACLACLPGSLPLLRLFHEQDPCLLLSSSLWRFRPASLPCPPSLPFAQLKAHVRMCLNFAPCPPSPFPC